MNNELATEAQIKYMKGLGINVFPNMTKSTAKELISSKLAENGESKPAEAVKTQPQGSKKEFHLSPEQVRTNAIDIALRMGAAEDERQLIELAQTFEEYLWNGN